MSQDAFHRALKEIVDYEEEEFDRVIRINLKSIFLFLKYTLPVMVKAGKGTVVNTASTSAILPGTRQCAYTAAKTAVLGLTATAAGEVGIKGVRVNAICPGGMDTELLRALISENPSKDTAALVRQETSVIPTGRWSTVDEVANLMMFLASDLSGNITGQHFNRRRPDQCFVGLFQSIDQIGDDAKQSIGLVAMTGICVRREKAALSSG